MDISCPHCRTEYELDDARVPGDGVTVKCTQCGHVFRVKRKEMVITLPVRGEEARVAQPASELPPPPPSREWKVRHSGGDVYVCRELTTLQKWIVEGKVGRDAEISLSGDVWKRLGNIPELASFFQVVEDAARGRALDAKLSEPTGPSPSAPTINDTWKDQRFSVPLQKATFPAPSLSPPPPSPPGYHPAPQPPLALPPSPQAAPQVPAPRPPLPVAQRRAYAALDDDEMDVIRPRSGPWWVLVFLLIALGAGGGTLYYFMSYLPAREAAEAAAREEADRRAEEARKKAELEARAQREAAERQALEERRAREAREAAADARAVAAAADAGVMLVDSGVPDAGREPVRSYEWYLQQGDRLRDRERPEAALDMYGRAADLQPDSIEPMTGRGLALLDLGQSLAAQAAFEQALKQNPRYGPAIMGTAEAYRALGKTEKAIEWYQRYLDVLPTGSEADVARNNLERLKK